LLVNLRKGSSIYLVNSHKNVEKIAGSIIGERTIYNIIKAMNNWKEIDL
jgi:pantothenate kinase